MATSHLISEVETDVFYTFGFFKFLHRKSKQEREKKASLVSQSFSQSLTKTHTHTLTDVIIDDDEFPFIHFLKKKN